jgi:hypothetical protein
MYSYTLSLTSALHGVVGQGRASIALPIPAPRGKNRYPVWRSENLALQRNSILGLSNQYQVAVNRLRRIKNVVE